MNEEEVRGKILLPFLIDLGFDISEISLEKSFSIILGKSKHIINGRADILCKRNGKNLFIIELKNDLISISEEDIEQGISYARLLTDNIAPFTIISNGKTTRIFDSISRQELTGTTISKQSTFWQDGCTLSTEIDLKIRYEALKNFVSFSTENLKIFCEKQVRDRMGPIIGDIDNPYAKYIKELHVQRQDLENTFNSFIHSEASIFGLIGAAGVGKTSAMCSLALQKLEDYFIFFYNAAIINQSPLEHISQDLNGVFSSKSESDSVLKKLDGIGKLLNKKIILFIDAIDECINSNLALELSEIALIVRNLDNVKICISCKTNIWGNILFKNNTPTHLFEELNKFHNLISSDNKCPGYLLEDFTDEEIDNIIPLYKNIFGFRGEISEPLNRALRNGFFLRIFSEVYSQKEIPRDINDKDLIRKYLQQSLEKTNIGFQSCIRILSKIGKILMEYKYSTLDAIRDNGIEVETLMEKLDFSLEQSIPEDLFTRNILIKSNKEGSYNVSFYYSKIRDYIICFHTYKLDKLSDYDFYDLLETFYENHISQSAISFYTENASNSHKKTIIKFKTDKSLSYVNNYNDYLERHFKTFKEKFDPNTTGNIGILLPEDLLYKDGYGLFPLDDNNTQSKVQFGKLAGTLSNDQDNDLFFQKGVNTFYGSNRTLLTKDQNKIVQQNIFEQLNKLITKGKISIYSSELLLLEQLSTILYFNSKQLELNYEIKDYYLPRFELIYPIDLINLKHAIYKFCVNEYYKRQNIDFKIRTEKINQALKNNIIVPKLNITGNFPPIEELSKIVEILLSKGYTIIKDHHLPLPDISINDTTITAKKNLEASQIRIFQYSKAQAQSYIDRFFGHFETCYKEFVEKCFPSFKEKFPFYMTLPHEYFIYMKGSNILTWGLWGYRKSPFGKIKVNFKEMTSIEEIFSSGETNTLRAFSLDQVLHNDYLHIIKTIDQFNTPKIDEFAVLRNWVHRFLKEDMKTIFKEYR